MGTTGPVPAPQGHSKARLCVLGADGALLTAGVCSHSSTVWFEFPRWFSCLFQHKHLSTYEVLC